MKFATIAIERLPVTFKENLAGIRSSAAGWTVAATTPHMSRRAMMMVRARRRIVVP
jgi:hypothetical protein